MELFRRKERRGGEFKLDSKGPCPIYSALSFILSLCAIDSLAYLLLTHVGVTKCMLAIVSVFPFRDWSIPLDICSTPGVNLGL